MLETLDQITLSYFCPEAVSDSDAFPRGLKGEVLLVEPKVAGFNAKGDDVAVLPEPKIDDD